MTLSSFFGTRVVWYGIEVTEIRNNISRKLWRKLLKKVDWVTTRTQNSQKILLSITNEREVLFFPDITFALRDLDLNKYLKRIKTPEIYEDFILWALADRENLMSEALRGEEKLISWLNG